MKVKKHYYTNGVRTIKLSDDDPIPEGFYKGRTFKVNTWNKGLTKETDERVKLNALHTQETLRNTPNLTSWNKGLTKETSEILKAVSEKISKSCKGRVPWNKGIPATDHQKQAQSEKMKGKIPWNKGYTKDTNKSLQSTSEKMKGHPDFVKDWKKAKQKEYETRKRNHSFNTSRPEDNYYKELVNLYGIEDVLRNYTDDRYPFNCDFYIPSLDLFIEYQGTWLHGGHPFDPLNEEDIRCLMELKEIALNKDSQFYRSAVYVWTDLDVRKLKTARENHLNFKFIYPNNLIIDK